MLEILLRRNTDFATMANIKAFLFITVRNKCLKYIDAEKRHRRSETEIGAPQDDKDDYVLAQMVRSEFLKWKFTAKLKVYPRFDRKSSKCSCIDGLDSQEIARMLRMTPAAVYNNKLKALKQLRNVLFDKKLLPLILGLMCMKHLQLMRPLLF